MQNNEELIWNKVSLARHKDRPNARFYIENILDEFIELHGDRSFRDYKAIIGDIGKINCFNVTVIGINKGKNTKENVDSNFGMIHPECYKKSLRLMKKAEKFKNPVICFVDTPGAFCGIGVEERGQGHAIAQNLIEMSRPKTAKLKKAACSMKITSEYLEELINIDYDELLNNRYDKFTNIGK